MKSIINKLFETYKMLDYSTENEFNNLYSRYKKEEDLNNNEILQLALTSRIYLFESNNKTMVRKAFKFLIDLYNHLTHDSDRELILLWINIQKLELTIKIKEWNIILEKNPDDIKLWTVGVSRYGNAFLELPYTFSKIEDALQSCYFDIDLLVDKNISLDEDEVISAVQKRYSQNIPVYYNLWSKDNYRMQHENNQIIYHVRNNKLSSVKTSITDEYLESFIYFTKNIEIKQNISNISLEI